MSFDNVCKYLVEKYPEAFVKWLTGIETTKIRRLKTELNLPPIHADSLLLLKIPNAILHLEFQTLPQSIPPLPLRALDYSVRLKRKYKCEVIQIIIFLKPSSSPLVYEDKYEDKTTIHRYGVIRLWEQNTAEFLAHPALYPLAALTNVQLAPLVLAEVAQKIELLPKEENRKELAAASILAGLRWDKTLVKTLFREEIMRESVIYQEIYQEANLKGKLEGRLEGRLEGLQQGLQQGEITLMMRQLTRRFGNLNQNLQIQITSLSITQLEDLGESLLDFQEINDLISWLNNNSN